MLTKYRLTRREPQETIRAELQSSTTKLRPLLERIGLTDKLLTTSDISLTIFIAISV